MGENVLEVQIVLEEYVAAYKLLKQRSVSLRFKSMICMSPHI